MGGDPPESWQVSSSFRRVTRINANGLLPLSEDLITDLTLDWEDAVSGGEVREARDYFATHPVLQSNPAHLEAVLSSVARTEQLNKLTRVVELLPVGNLDTHWATVRPTAREVVTIVETLARAIDYCPSALAADYPPRFEALERSANSQR